MRNAYALLGLAFIIVFGGAFILMDRAHAPSASDIGTIDFNLKDTAHIMKFTLSSPVLEESGMIPRKYTCRGENINPPLLFENVPVGTKSFVLLITDPDIPDFVKKERGIEVFDHWVLFDIPGDSNGLPDGDTFTRFNGTHGVNSRGDLGYTGPCPPDGEHRYIFELYALNTEVFPVDFESSLNSIDLLNYLDSELNEIVIEKTTLTGRYAETMKEGPLRIAQKIVVREMAGDYVVSTMGVPERRRDLWVADAVVSQDAEGTILVKNKTEGMTVVLRQTDGKFTVVEGYEN